MGRLLSLMASGSATCSPLGSTLSGHLEVELLIRFGHALHGKFAEYARPPLAAHPPSPLEVAGELRDRGAERRRIVGRHEKPGSAGFDRLRQAAHRPGA